MVLQNFDLIKDESYKLKVHVTMTVRPVGLTMKVRLRNGRRATELALRQQQASGAAASTTLRPTADSSATGACIIHASNSGTSEALASRLANDAAERGVGIRSIDVAKDAVAKLPRGVPVVIITASYNGEPADDAVDFVAWLESLEEHELDGVNFAVFGCGKRTPFQASNPLNMYLFSPSQSLCLLFVASHFIFRAIKKTHHGDLWTSSRTDNDSRAS